MNKLHAETNNSEEWKKKSENNGKNKEKKNFSKS